MNALLRSPLVLLVATCLVSTRAAAQNDDATERRAYADAFVSHRAGPSGRIPDGALFDQWRQVSAMPRAAFAFADAAWRSVGPAGLTLSQESFGGVYASELKSGRINSIAIHPTDGRTILVGSQGGVWRTTTGGHLWNATFDTQCTLSLGAVAFDPVQPDLAYALTGDARGRTQPGCGVLRSIDGGRTWLPPVNNPLVGSSGFALVVDRATAGSPGTTRLLAATDRGLYLSLNSGTSWNQVIAAYVTSVVQHPTNPMVFYASRVSNTQSPVTTVVRSTDGGVTWTPMPSPIANPGTFARLTLAVSPAAPTRLFAYAGNLQTRAFIGISRWDDLTQQWLALPVTGINTNGQDYPYTIGEQQDYDQAFAVNPQNANHLFVGGVGAFMSMDGGFTFQVAARNVHVDWHHVGFDPRDPDHMVAGTDGGFYQSFDGGRTWRANNTGLAISQIYPGMSAHPSGQWLFAGLQDNSAIYFTGSPVWNNLSFLGDGGYTAVHPTTAATIFVTHSFANFVMRRRNGGKEEGATNGIFNNDRAGLPRPIVMNPAAPTTLYFGTQRLYRTIDEGTSWSPITTDATRGSGIITTIAIAPSNPNVIYAGTSDGIVIVTLDGGQSFQQFVFGTNRRFSKIIVDPQDPLHAIAAATTLGAPKLTETRDGGLTFNSSIGGGLPDVAVHTALWVPGSSVLMLGTDFGVLQSPDNGNSWTQGPPGLPNTIVYELTWAPMTATIFAATFARGAWAFRPGVTQAVRRGDVDNDGQLTAQDALVIQQAIVGQHPPIGRTLYPNGDANCDGKLTSVDAMLVLRSSIGLSTTGTCTGTLARPVVRPYQEDGGSVRPLASLLTQ
jgi:photosystem II stability/assembly factor-like uncharacterized protein